MSRTRTQILGATGILAVAFSLACGGGGSSTVAPPASNSGTVSFMATDATSETWSNVGVIIRKAVLMPTGVTDITQGVTIYDGSKDSTQINLLQVDELNELLANTSGVPAGTYTHLVVVVDGQASNITLVPAVDPVTGAVPGAQVAAGLITVKGTFDAANPTWIDLPTIKLTNPITVANGGTYGVSTDFDLSHPAFIVTHDITAADGTAATAYVVNFGAAGAFHDHPAATLDKFYLRRHFGSVTAVTSSSITMLTEHGQTVTINTDPNNPTLFYDLDVKPLADVSSSTVPATLTAATGNMVECTARFQVQADGTYTLAAVRVWYSPTGNNSLPKWRPEGHITKVDQVNNIIYVIDNFGVPQPITINAATNFYFHGGTTPIGTGTAFLANLDRYFKVHVTVADPTVGSPVAADVDIERGVFEGNLTTANPDFTYTKTWADTTVSTHTLTQDPTTFSSWDFTFPGSPNTSTFWTEAADQVGAFSPYGISSLNWVGGATNWTATSAVFMPIALAPTYETVTTPYTTASGALMVTPHGSATAIPVTLSATALEQPLVTTFTKTGATVTVTVQPAGNWANVLTATAKVRVYGVPDISTPGALKAYYVNIYN